ncbi:hypothetical protein [Pedobacter terrae]|nr:hypothetical protein [Pedobacter terrae]
MKYYILTALIAFIISSCRNPDSTAENKRKDQPSSQTKGKFYSVDKASFILSLPEEFAPKVIDSINSSPIHNEYCLLATKYKLSVIETKGNWSKVKVVAPDWLTKTYIGWIHTKSLTEYHEQVYKPSEPKSINSNKPLIKTQFDESDILKVKISNAIKDVNRGDDISSVDLTSLKGINTALSIFKIYAQLVSDGNASSDKEILILAKQLKNKCIASQLKNFPKIRRAYYKLTKDQLWELDIDVTISGKSNSILIFTGGYFAANANIKQTQEALHGMLDSLRFKQTQYRWYKGQEEYTYYIIKSNSDSVLID